MTASRERFIEASGLSRTFGDGAGGTVRAVEHASLEVEAGEVVLIMGPSGSGKTTLLSILGCLLAPSEGQLRITGTDVRALAQGQLTKFRLRHIGFVFQSFRLISALNVSENVELPLNLAGIQRPESTLRSLQLLEELGLANRARFAPAVLSAGARQRVAVARALVADPPVLLADEPTGNLDSTAGEAVIRMLCEAATVRRKAVVIVSHDARIRDHVHRVVQMEDGRLEKGGHKC